jgi:hypothetical protein
MKKDVIYFDKLNISADLYNSLDGSGDLFGETS